MRKGSAFGFKLGRKTYQFFKRTQVVAMSDDVVEKKKKAEEGVRVEIFEHGRVNIYV